MAAWAYCTAEHTCGHNVRLDLPALIARFGDTPSDQFRARPRCSKCGGRARLIMGHRVMAVTYQIGEEVFWLLRTVTGEAIFIGHPKTAKHGEVLVLAAVGEVGVEIDAEDCQPTGQSYRATGRDYRLRYFRNFPGKLQGARRQKRSGPQFMEDQGPVTSWRAFAESLVEKMP